MDLKPSAWHLDHLLDAVETDFAESASNAATEQGPHGTRVIALRRTARSMELDYVKARLQAIGLGVGATRLVDPIDIDDRRTAWQRNEARRA